MSLDVSLAEWRKATPCTCEYCGHTHTREGMEEIFSASITHNLNCMAEEAGIYEQVWRPDEIGITKAAQLIEPLRAGIALMKSDPERFKKFDSSNGWGLYEHFVPWLDTYLAACEKYPDADVSVSR